MRVSCFRVAVLALALGSFAAADECTEADFTEIASMEEDLYSSTACPAIQDSTSATVDDACNDDCLSFLGDMIDKIPDCTMSGYSTKGMLQKLVDACATATGTDTTTDSETKGSKADEKEGDGAATASIALSCLAGAGVATLMLATQ